MAVKISLKSFLVISFFFVVLSACLDPVDIKSFMSSPEVQGIIDTTKKPPTPPGSVIIDPNPEVPGLTAGDGSISGLVSGKYYMVEEYDGTDFQRNLFIQADGKIKTDANGNNKRDLSTIGPLEGTQITGLTNNLTYKVFVAEPFAGNKKYEYFEWSDTKTAIKESVVSSNGGITTIKVIGAGDYYLDLHAEIANDKYYEVMKVSGDWNNASRTSALYNGAPDYPLDNIDKTNSNVPYSYNDKFDKDSEIGIYQYQSNVFTSAGLTNGIPLNTRSIVEKLPAKGESKDYVFAEYNFSKYYSQEKVRVTRFTFVKIESELQPLTGTVSINGTLIVVGQTLTANTTSLGGAGAISYQWKRGGTDIPGANASTYSLVAADEGKTITVTVTRAGYSGSVTSDPTDVVTFPALTGTVSISGTPIVGNTLTATAVLDGAGAISYQWKRGTTNIGTNASSYTLVNADEGSTITVTVTCAGYSGSLTSAPTATITFPAISGTVIISVVGGGTAKVGQTLTAALSGFNGASGTEIYQWKRGTTNIGTNASTYTLVTADEGKLITVDVTGTFNSGIITSNTIGPIKKDIMITDINLSVNWNTYSETTWTNNCSAVPGNDGNTKYLDLTLNATVAGATSYDWYFGSDDSGTPFATGVSSILKKFSMYTKTGYSEDPRWFQQGTHTITLVTDVGSFIFTYNNP